MTQECNIDKIIKLLDGLLDQLGKKRDIPPSKKAPVNNNKLPSKSESDDNKSSRWARIRKMLKKICKEKNEAGNQASDSGGGSQGGSNRTSDEDQKDADLQIRKLQSDIRQMKSAFEKLAQFQTQMSEKLKFDIPSSKLEAILDNTDRSKTRPQDLKEIRKKISNLKFEIPSLLHKQSSRGLSITDSQTAEENGEINETGSDIYLPGLHIDKDFTISSAFEEVVEKFKALKITRKLCLLSFAVFPENKEVKKTMLMYWWIGEGFLRSDDPDDPDDPEDLATRILGELSTKGLLEPVENVRKLEPNSFKMEPHVHSAVICLAKHMDLFDLYNEKGKLIMEKTVRQKVCLVRGSSLLPKAKTSAMQPKTLQTVFNSSERYPDFTFKWFPFMDSLKVLYLGRWERTAKRHIEVESTEFLKNIKALKNLRLASFQGISRIEKLENPICALPELVILDLRACYNLEVLPEDIGLLKKLIYLDVSECFMLDRMPKGIAQLSRLQVLKGFVISESDDERNCAVKHLVNLRKLSITVNKNKFKVEYLMESLRGLTKLKSLKIAWGARFPEEREDGDKGKADLEEGKKQDDVEAEKFKSEKKSSPSRQATGTIQNKSDDQKGQSTVEGDGDKGKTDLEKGKKQDGVETEKPKSDKAAEGEKKASPPRESSDTIQKKPDDKSSVEKEGDGDREKADLEEGKKQDEVEAERPKSEKVVEGDEKTSPPQEPKDKIENKTDNKTKVEKEGDGDKGKTNPEEGKKHDEVEAKSSKSDDGVEGLKKANPSGESTDGIQNKPDDHQRGDKQEEKRDEEKKKVYLEEGKNKDEIKAESSKPDKVIEGVEKTSPSQESKDTIQSNLDYHKENSKVQENGDGEKNGADLKKLDGGEAKTQKPDKAKKFGLFQKKPDGLNRVNSIVKLFMGMENETEKRLQESITIYISKLPSSLKKLELECFPNENPPSWLNPKNLDCLEKLSIKGGKLTRISNELPTAENNCNVRILRLKYLHEFKAEWKDLQTLLFPKMILLEKYQCPKVAFCPTDGNGVWRSQSQTSPNK